MPLEYSDPMLVFNAQDFIRQITKQREEIIEAFIAKYNYPPDEIEQVVETTPTQIIWYVRRKAINDTKENTTETDTQQEST